MKPTWTIAWKDFRDALRSYHFLILLGSIILLTTTSILLASNDFYNKLAEYNQAMELLKNLGKAVDNQSPVFYPLKMFRGVVNYFEIIGAIIGILLGYLSIAKEKGKNTLQLILSRPVSRLSIFWGKTIGNSMLVLSTLLITWIGVFLIMRLVGHVTFTSAEMMKLGMFFLVSYFYIMFFFSLTAFLALSMKTLPNVLIISFSIWLLFVLIIPQIGDTMDPDNQIPGGFFKSMHINHAQGKDILKKFNTYETVRNGLEATSVTKHFERLSFALLGIKDMYNNMPLGKIMQTEWLNSFWVFAASALASLATFLALNKASFKW